MSNITKKQLEELLKQIESRLKGLEAQLPEGITLESAITQVNENVNKAKTLSGEMDSIAQSVRSQQQEVKQVKESVDSIELELKGQKETLLAASKAFSTDANHFPSLQI